MRGNGAFRRALTAALIAGLATGGLGLSGAPEAGADELGDLRDQRNSVQAKKAKVAAQVDALKASDQEVGRAIDTINGNVSSQRSALLKADAAVQAARRAVDAATAEEEAASAALAAARGSLRDTALLAYATGGSPLKSLGGSGNPNDLERTKAYGDAITGQRTDALDQLNGASKDLARARAAKQAASAAADRRLRAAQLRLGELNDALARQQGFEDQVQSRLDAKLSEAAALEGTDRELADRITRQEAALAAKLAARGPRPGGGGPITIVGEGDIVSVRGIRVARSIANNVAGLLAAADGAGLNLSGGGYRSSDSQIALRRAHCGSSNYDVYQKPASQCRPPTARPGQSMHERGLAIDFTCNGSTIQSRSSPCYKFLSANAGRFGLYNLPSEAWHWSTNGN